MNEKETAELRRRFRAEKSAINCISGCFVNEKREIVSEFHETVGLMDKDDVDAVLALLRKALSGGIGKNLLDIPFSTQQVMDSDEHRLLMALRSPSAESDAMLHVFYELVAQSLLLEGNYLILLAQDAYDVPAFGKDGDRGDSTEVFRYCLCAVCPIKETKPALGFFINENRFRSIAADRVIGAPQLGFLFPCFDDRTANIYNVLYYTKSIEENHPELVEALFRTPVPMPAASQKELFQNLLAETVSEDCSLDVAVAVRDELCERIHEHKTAKEEEPLVISKRTVKQVLSACGVPAPRVEAFEEKYDDAFGANTELPPQNLVDMKQLEVSTPDVSIRVNPDRSDLVEARMIDGKRYILIRAESNVEVNGVSIVIKE